jgi:hypothetical protein
LAANQVQRKSRTISTLAIGTSVNVTMLTFVIKNRKSRMNRNVHVRFCEKQGVQPSLLTRLCDMLKWH